MIRNAMILAAMIASCVGYMLYADYRDTAPVAPASTQKISRSPIQKSPDFTFQDLSGKKYKLSDFEGKTIVLNFWASWCAPCVIEFPQMLALAKSTEKESLFIFLSADDNRVDIERFLARHGKSLPRQNVIVGWDQDKSIIQGLFQTYKLPETLLIKPDLSIAEKIIGADVDWNGQAMQEKIKSLSHSDQ